MWVSGLPASVLEWLWAWEAASVLEWLWAWEAASVLEWLWAWEAASVLEWLWAWEAASVLEWLWAWEAASVLELPALEWGLVAALVLLGPLSLLRRTRRWWCETLPPLSLWPPWQR